jgi:small subunit ribosomal protein S2
MADKSVVSLKDLLEAGVHFGHRIRRRHPKMGPFIYTARDGVHIFDLEQVVQKLSEAVGFLKELGKDGKSLLMIGTKRQAMEAIEKAATESGAAFITKRWVGGLLTNWGQVSQNIERLKKLEAKREAGEFKNYTKLERLNIDRQIQKLSEVYGGLRELENLPDAVFILDVHREKAAADEAKNKSITIVAICDTNADPQGIDYVIPGNDDARRAIELYCEILGKGYQQGRKQMKSRG